MAAWDDLSRDVQQSIYRQRAAVLGLCQTYAGKWEAEAKANIAWQPRTGNAGNLMNGRAIIFDNRPESYVVGVRLAHGVDYGIWLEVTDRPRGASARPTIRRVLGDLPPGPSNRAEFLDRARNIVTGLPF
jgi:hypothetical protein